MEKNIPLQWATAKILRDARKAKGMPQRKLADFSSLSLSHVSAIERGNKGITLSALLKITETLEIDILEIIQRIMKELVRGPVSPQKKQGRPCKRKCSKKAMTRI